MSINPRPVPARASWPAVPGQPARPAPTSAACAQDGGTYRRIAAAAGLAPATVYGLASGRRRPNPAPPPPSSP